MNSRVSILSALLFSVIGAALLAPATAAMAAVGVDFAYRAEAASFADPEAGHAVFERYEPWLYHRASWLGFGCGAFIGVWVFVTLRYAPELAFARCYWTGVSILAASCGWLCYLRSLLSGRDIYGMSLFSGPLVLFYLVPLGVLVVLMSFYTPNK